MKTQLKDGTYKCWNCEDGFIDVMAVSGKYAMEYYNDNVQALDDNDDIDTFYAWLDDNWQDFMEDARNDYACECNVCKGTGVVDWVTNCIRIVK